MADACRSPNRFADVRSFGRKAEEDQYGPGKVALPRDREKPKQEKVIVAGSGRAPSIETKANSTTLPKRDGGEG
jgi:hypothetical protein